MSSLEAPTIDIFEPEKSYKVLGVGYVSMRSHDGVRLDLSETGALAVDQDPEFGALLERMGEFIAEHGMYKAGVDVPDREPGDILRIAESKATARAWKRKDARLASAYHPDAVPGVVVKAFDYDRKSALMQFYLGAWLHSSLGAADDGINSPAQLAVFRAAGTGHRTTVMDYMPGKNLYDIARTLGSDKRYEEDVHDIDAIAIELGSTLREKIARMTGWRGFLIANDLCTTRNIIDPDPETVTPDNLAEREVLSIIDQPAVGITSRKYNIALAAAARFVPLLSAGRSERPVIENPATSS